MSLQLLLLLAKLCCQAAASLLTCQCHARTEPRASQTGGQVSGQVSGGPVRSLSARARDAAGLSRLAREQSCARKSRRAANKQMAHNFLRAIDPRRSPPEMLWDQNRRERARKRSHWALEEAPKKATIASMFLEKAHIIGQTGSQSVASRRRAGSHANCPPVDCARAQERAAPAASANISKSNQSSLARWRPSSQLWAKAGARKVNR